LNTSQPKHTESTHKAQKSLPQRVGRRVAARKHPDFGASSGSTRANRAKADPLRVSSFNEYNNVRLLSNAKHPVSIKGEAPSTGHWDGSGAPGGARPSTPCDIRGAGGQKKRAQTKGERARRCQREQTAAIGTAHRPANAQRGAFRESTFRSPRSRYHGIRPPPRR